MILRPRVSPTATLPPFLPSLGNAHAEPRTVDLSALGTRHTIVLVTLSAPVDPAGRELLSLLKWLAGPWTNDQSPGRLHTDSLTRQTLRLPLDLHHLLSLLV